MIGPGGVLDSALTEMILPGLMIFGLCFAAVWLGAKPFLSFLRQREREYDVVLRRRLLIDVNPRLAAWASIGLGPMLAVFVYAVFPSLVLAFAVAVLGVFLAVFIVRHLSQRRMRKLEDQLVGGIQTLASGVRAGLNLVQAMQLVARDGPKPLRQEFEHLLREYEFGMSLDEAMRSAAVRIGSGDFRLLFAALLTHRERGGDLGQTLDRIAESIREIQRLESRVEALTAQGRATARFLGVFPLIMLGILRLITPESVKALFEDPVGKGILMVILALTMFGYVWIRKIMQVDI